MRCLRSSSLSFPSLPSLSAIVGVEFGGLCRDLEEEEFEEEDCGFAAGDEKDDAEDLLEERKLGVGSSDPLVSHFAVPNIVDQGTGLLEFRECVWSPEAGDFVFETIWEYYCWTRATLFQLLQRAWRLKSRVYLIAFPESQ